MGRAVMLKELYIKNFALIDELRAEFAPGFNVLTGETGAGKSILIDALNLILGGRWEEVELRSGSDEAVVEAAFEVERVSQVAELLRAEGIPQEPGEYLVLRRHLLRGGRSKAYINGRLSSAATLRTLRGFLVDIYGQGQASSLQSPRKHLHLLDAYADLVEEVRAFRGLYERFRQLQRELGELLSKEREKEKRQDLLEWERKEIDAARLRDGEEEELLSERTILSNVERLYETAEGAYATLYAEEGSILDQLAIMLSKLKEASRIDPRLQGPLESLEAARVSLEEAASALRDYRERIP
ncbi:MAG: AAA family ATPase, partial [Candidatus Methylomirabilales bacterium]